MNKIASRLRKMAAATVAEAMNEEGFKLCSTGGGSNAYYKDLPGGKTLYVTDSDKMTLAPDSFDAPVCAAIMIDDESGKMSDADAFVGMAQFEDVNDFLDNYSDMSQYTK